MNRWRRHAKRREGIARKPVWVCFKRPGDNFQIASSSGAADKAEYKRRFSHLVKTAKGKEVAGNIFLSLLKTCRKVVTKGGRASGD